MREFEDAGYSGKFLERPDLDDLRDLVASGGVFHCAACGSAMATTYHPLRKIGYYRCGKRYRLGTHACSLGKNHRAEDTEAVVRNFVSSVFKGPQRLRHGRDARQGKSIEFMGARRG